MEKIEKGQLFTVVTCREKYKKGYKGALYSSSTAQIFLKKKEEEERKRKKKEKKEERERERERQRERETERETETERERENAAFCSSSTEIRSTHFTKTCT